MLGWGREVLPGAQSHRRRTSSGSLDTALINRANSGPSKTEAAIKLVVRVSHGLLRPAVEDFAMLRLVLLALLPQIGGILLMVGRSSKN